ncbi:hypothetical protein CV093_19665 [Oceanobacillus sp. 143]|uniref:Uncharacterized protein n=1 Tax=Oceanobacillus zhaokaii TaxID=2052660 RepID=A0A345PL76_9BACI|nr:hypothetical protein [Oceanobacillus zhaokaii]AXI10756.1 hypothetical protein CUC15_18190 [Oceanobacillus zhaokaii]QGS69674.1 hypothetical protein CV093_19665 [Oceanobacillus sp. 143]
MTKKGIERGQSITFRVPSDTPDYLLKELSLLKEKERRNFSSTIANFVLKAVNESQAKERETITIPLPKRLTKEQKSWLKHEHSEALIGSILFHLLNDPMRATTLLASLNSNSSNIDDALYLQETSVTKEFSELDDTSDEMDLDDLNLDGIELPVHEEIEKEEENPLGDFFSSMNK